MFTQSNWTFLIEPDEWANDETATKDSKQEKGAWGNAESCGVSQGMFKPFVDVTEKWKKYNKKSFGSQCNAIKF